MTGGVKSGSGRLAAGRGPVAFLGHGPMARSILIPELPRFVPPMLAKRGTPFDSSQHLFEIKWDGTRVLAFVESHGYRLVNRHRADGTERYPELGFLNNLPAGVVLDGGVGALDH